MVHLLTFQWVHDNYTSGGWTEHHAQMLEYEETSAKDSKPSITFEVVEPAKDKQKDWEVDIITSNRVSYTCSLLLLLELFDFQLSLFLLGFASLYVE